MIAYTSLTVLPSWAELASMWPIWTALGLGCLVWLYAWLEEEREWREYQKRLRRREMADRIKARANERN